MASRIDVTGHSAARPQNPIIIFMDPEIKLQGDNKGLGIWFLSSNVHPVSMHPLFFLLLTLVVTFVPLPSYGVELLLSWDQNTEEELAGYYLYSGTSSRNYKETPIMLPKGGLPEESGRVGYALSLTASEGVTYYFAVTAYDESGYETDFSNEVQYSLPGEEPDTTPPTGSIAINGGDAVTRSLETILTLSAMDDGRELDENGLMTFSNDGEAWTDPEPYAPGKIWTLLPGRGEKTVYVKFRDAAGNWMTEPAQARIYYEASEISCDDPQIFRPVSATASSEWLPRFSRNNALDGNPLTVWSAFSFVRKDQFITLDLGEMKRFTGLSLYASRMFGTDFFPSDFQIEVSRDNVAWASIGKEWGYTPPLQPPYSGRWVFDGIDCRYVRITITKSKTLFLFLHLAQIAEIEVHGCDLEEDTSLLVADVPAVSASQEASRRIKLEDAPGASQEKPTAPGRPEVRFE